MRILEFRVIGEDELISRLRQVRLKGFGEPLIYDKARLELVESVDTQSLTPPQRYVLRGTVNSIIDLADAFERQFYLDIFALRGALFFWLEGSNPLTDPPIPLLPPMVERSFEPGDWVADLINDGMHRVWSARRLGRRTNIILAKDVPSEYPYYAYAIREGWAAVEEFDELPDVFQKKEYRIPSGYKALFRNFNAIFPGVQAQRKQSNPTHIKE